MKIFVKKTAGLQLPVKFNEKDGAWDIFATSDAIINADKEDIIQGGILEDIPTLYRKINYISYQTNLAITPENQNYHIELFSRSSNSKKQLILCNPIPTIDTGYKNFIEVRFFPLFQPKDLTLYKNSKGDFEIVGKLNPDFLYKKGDRIVQMKERKNAKFEFEIVEELPEVDGRKEKGFGSSDKK